MKSGKSNVNEVTDYVLDDIKKNAAALSKFGYRHSKVLQALSVLIFNRSQSCSRILNDALPLVFSSLSACRKQRKPKGTIITREPRIQVTKVVIFEHFESFGWVKDCKLGPIQLVHDSTRVRELVKTDTKSMRLIGFKARKTESGNWEFSIPYKSLSDIKVAFLDNKKANYVLLGLHTALAPGIPPITPCIIPHDNKFSMDDL